MNEDFSDIIKHNYTGIQSHKQMSLEMRAAQFAPFAALSGYENSINDAAIIAEKNYELQNTYTQDSNNEI